MIDFSGLDLIPLEVRDQLLKQSFLFSPHYWLTISKLISLKFLPQYVIPPKEGHVEESLPFGII